jgi:hypothetical protein
MRTASRGMTGLWEQFLQQLLKISEAKYYVVNIAESWRDP